LWTPAWIEANVQTFNHEFDLGKTNVSDLLEGRAFLALKVAKDGLSAVGEGVSDQCKFPEGDSL
jgi:hypothetical protein